MTAELENLTLDGMNFIGVESELGISHDHLKHLWIVLCDYLMKAMNYKYHTKFLLKM